MERISSRNADPVTILAARILDKLAGRELDYKVDLHTVVHAEMCMYQLYRAMSHHRYLRGGLWLRTLALCQSKGAIKITTIRQRRGRPKRVVMLTKVPASLVAHRRRKIRRRRPQTEWFTVNVLGASPSLRYVPGDPLAEHGEPVSGRSSPSVTRFAIRPRQPRRKSPRLSKS